MDETSQHRLQDRVPYQPSLLKDILFLIVKIAATLLVFVLLFTFMFGFYRCTDNSMGPAFKNGDLVIYYRLDKDYNAQDVIVLKYNGKEQLCRVIATAGDTVNITDQGLIINGAIQQETNIFSKTERYANGVAFPITVQEGQVFVLSDNRTNATDSRVYGAINKSEVEGKVITLLRNRNF